MSTEKERWAKLAGLPEPTDKQQLDENFVGMGMVGNIFDREKEQYEDAFEHFLSERYEEKVEENYATEVRDAWDNLDMDARVKLLLTVFDDPDMAEKMAERDFNELPDAATSNMRMDMLGEAHGDYVNKWHTTQSGKTLSGEPSQTPREKLLSMERNVVQKVIRQTSEDMSSNSKILTREYIDEIINALEDLKTSDF